MDTFFTEGPAVAILIIQGLFAWALWSLRRVFVRTDDYELKNIRFSKRIDALERYINHFKDINKLNDIKIDREVLRRNINIEKMLVSEFGHRFIVEYYSVDNSSIKKIEIRAEKYDREIFYAEKEKNVIKFYDKNYKSISIITGVINIKKIPYIRFL